MKEPRQDKPRMIREANPDFLENFDKLAQAMREGNLDKAIEEVIPTPGVSVTTLAPATLLNFSSSTPGRPKVVPDSEAFLQRLAERDDKRT